MSGELKTRLRTHLVEKNELYYLFGLSIALGFLASFNDYGEQFSLQIGLTNWLTASLAALLCITIYFLSTKIYALELGYTTKLKIATKPLILALLIIALSNGWLWFFGFILLEILFLEDLRIGSFRYKTNGRDLARITLVGPVVLACFVLLLTIPFSFSTLLAADYFYVQLLKISIGIAIWQLIPLPYLPGFNILYYSKLLHISIGTSVIFFLLALLLTPWVVALAIGLFMFLLSIVAAHFLYK